LWPIHVGGIGYAAFGQSTQTAMTHRVQFDFAIEFTNGGAIQGQDFRLDIDGEDIPDRELADYLVADMRLLMVGAVRILNKRIVVEAHKRKPFDARPHDSGLIDLSHTIENGLVTYKGLPAPIICDYLSREASRERYAPGTEFQIARIDMVANTGTYLDCPFHRYAEGKDLAAIVPEQFTDLDAVVVRATQTRAIDVDCFRGRELRGRAVLVHTDWSRHWNTERYHAGHPYLTERAAQYLRDCAVKLVGIDSMNIDDTASNARPVHTTLLGSDILIVEHLCELHRLPEEGFTFSAIAPKFRGVGTFPVRALAKLPRTM
jgi:kynurenine formamidase